MKCYVLDGHELRPATDGVAWARWFEAADRTVARTKLLDGSELSTVFLGIDHSFGHGPPLLFETAHFAIRTADILQRYSTWAEAEEGHARWLERLTAAERAKLPQGDA